jgi:hypothetical protein
MSHQTNKAQASVTYYGPAQQQKQAKKKAKTKKS